MNILIDIAHPAHVHLFRNFVVAMEQKGHTIYISARNKDITFKLLDSYNLKYIILGKHYKSLIGKAFGAVIHILKLVYLSITLKIDILLDSGTLYPSFVSFVTRKKNIVVANTDADPFIKYTKYFGAVFLSPISFYKDFGKNHFKYEIINELAFLHPKYFTPNPEILKLLEIKEGKKIILLRFVLWKALDDIGYTGYSVEEIRVLVKEFNKYGQVLISCEYALPQELEIYHIEKNKSLKFGQLQHLEYYSSLFFGESGAMASECAVLGVPAVFISPKQLGFINELDSKYGLVHCFLNKSEAFNKAIKILETENSKIQYMKKRENLLKDKINVTDFLIWLVENMPDSIEVIKKNNQFYKKFIE